MMMPREIFCGKRAGPRGYFGFTMIMVLIVAFIGLGMIGAVAHIMTISSGAGRAASSAVARYNFLQRSLEEGKAALKKAMDNGNPVPRYFHKDGYAESDAITSADALLLKAPLGRVVDKRPISEAVLKRLGVFGGKGNLSVRIYDMQYDPSRVQVSGGGAGQISPRELEFLPPSLTVVGHGDYSHQTDTLAPGESGDPFHGSAVNVGVYLIRASMSIDGARALGNDMILDSAVIQSNNM